MDTAIAIKVENLTKTYQLYDNPLDRLKEALHPFRKYYHHDFFALKDISIEINKGETVGVIGKNGAGKSTLLKIITGVLTPSDGSVHINGRIASLLELGAGFNPEYTGLENIYLQGTLMGYTQEEMDNKLDDIIAFADIGDFVQQNVKIYSSGMFARLAFAIAINVDPDILIVDEALSVGDMAFQAKCFNKFKEFQKKGKTILFVTHSIDLIIKYCQSAILIDNGSLVVQGDVKEATEKFRKLMVTVVSQDTTGNNVDNNSFDELSSNYNLKSKLPINKKANIYGSLEAEIIDFAILNSENKITNYVEHNDEYTILMSINFHQDIYEPIFAYTIKSIDGMELTGTNSNHLDEVVDVVRNGEIMTVKFTQKMILNAGCYFLALGCVTYENEQLKVFHRIYDAVSINVVSPIPATGIAFSETKINIKKYNNG